MIISRGIIRAFYFLFILFIMAGIAIYLPVNAQTTGTNHPPLIASTPAVNITTDDVYQYTIIAEDKDGDQLTYDLTTAPAEATLNNSTVSWQPTTPGTYNFVIQVKDQHNGFDTQAWQVTVRVGRVATIIITPNDRPTLVNIGDNQQFTATLADTYHNAITNKVVAWSTDETTGHINDQGVFFADQGGIGFVAAEVDDIKTSIGLVVKDIRSELAHANPAVNTNKTVTKIKPTNNNSDKIITNNQNIANNEEMITNDESISEEKVPARELAIDETGEKNTEATDENASCVNWPHWLIITLLIIYAMLLNTYYHFEKKNTSGTWWILPLLITIIGLIPYYKYFCPGTYLWWPWILIGIGIVITIFYKGHSKNNTDIDDDRQNELPL